MHNGFLLKLKFIKMKTKLLSIAAVLLFGIAVSAQETQTIKQEVKNINAYLVNAENIIIQKRSKPLSKLKEMSFGSMPNDGGNLLLTQEEKNKFVENYPETNKLIKNFSGSQEFINGQNKYCLIR